MHLWFARFGSKDLNKSENLRLFSFVLGESKNLRAWALAFCKTRFFIFKNLKNLYGFDLSGFSKLGLKSSGCDFKNIII